EMPDVEAQILVGKLGTPDGLARTPPGDLGLTLGGLLPMPVCGCGQHVGRRDELVTPRLPAVVLDVDARLPIVFCKYLRKFCGLTGIVRPPVRDCCRRCGPAVGPCDRRQRGSSHFGGRTNRGGERLPYTGD